jgi:hypothetical protein
MDRNKNLLLVKVNSIVAIFVVTVIAILGALAVRSALHSIETVFDSTPYSAEPR